MNIAYSFGVIRVLSIKIQWMMFYISLFTYYSQNLFRLQMHYDYIIQIAN